MDLTERRPGVVTRHPWEVARARFFRRLIATHGDLRTVRRVLDIGAGDGWFAGDLAVDLPPSAEIVCWDINYRSEDLAAPAAPAAPDGPSITRTAAEPAGRFDVVLALDVLEHVHDDESFLARSIVPAVAPDGIAVISVPAHPWLFSDHDRALEHVRRYRPSDFRALLRCHLDLVTTGSLFATLVAPRALDLVRQRLGAMTEATGVGQWRGGPRITRFVTSTLDADAAIAGRLARWGWALPGLSTWAVARLRP